MKIKLLVSFLAVVLTPPVFADKPEWAGKGKPTAEQKAAHKSAMVAKDEQENKINEEVEGVKDKNKNKDKDKDKQKKAREDKERTDKVSDIEKHKEKKLSQPQKELDKGSEKGKESRENSKKWWQFWE
ncbi:MAG: hypothetical protein QNK26_02625 [Moritella sp.]|uniref:hypothetical protein n=1 Tax=Moritella sp. TaxID=78556 RepID=UPI0029A9A275|nr:hypothetical protein [Moritella sp.]MDX2319474.1 hypothetical protein [Moritella sp.]